MVVTQQFGRGTDERSSQLLLRDLLTTETIPLAAGASSFGPGGRPAAVFSTDGTRVAYGWTDTWAPGMPVAQVRTVLRVTGSANGAAPRTLVGPDPAGRRDRSSRVVPRRLSDPRPRALAWREHLPADVACMALRRGRNDSNDQDAGAMAER